MSQGGSENTSMKKRHLTYDWKDMQTLAKLGQGGEILLVMENSIVKDLNRKRHAEWEN